MRITGLLLALAGCDQLFGLPDIQVRPDAINVTGRFVQRFVYNDGQFHPMLLETSPQSVSASATLDDGTASVVDYHQDGTFTFPVAYTGQAYRFALATPDGAVDIESDASALQLATLLPTRSVAQRAPVSNQTMLQFRMNGGGPLLGQGWVTSTGIASQTNTGATTGNVDLDWRSVDSFGVQLGLLDTTDYNDALYFLDMRTSPYYSIAQSYRTAIDQIDGYPTMITGTLAPVSSTSCAHVTAALADEYARIVTAFPGANGSGSDWVIYATPALEIAGADPLIVAYGPTANPPPNADLDVTFANIYDGYSLLGAMGMSVLYPLQLPNTSTPFQAFLGGRVFVPIANASTCASTVDLASGLAQLAGNPVVAGVPVTADQTLVSLPASEDVTISWNAIAPGPVDYTFVTVYELRAVSGITVATRVDATATTASSVHFPTSLFAAGSNYVVSFNSIIGFGNASSGDFAQVTYPNGYATTWSRWFTFQ